jgi:hypothetical protein
MDHNRHRIDWHPHDAVAASVRRNLTIRNPAPRTG